MAFFIVSLGDGLPEMDLALPDHAVADGQHLFEHFGLVVLAAAVFWQSRPGAER